MADNLTADRLRQLLHYDPKTGVFRWRIDRGGRAKAGSVAGTIRKQNHYRVITIDYEKYMASHLAFCWMTGEMPPLEMDHRNCIPDDDRWSNLRPATSMQNKCNVRIRKNKGTPFKGVSFHKHTNKYRAYITICGRHISLGYFHDPETAHAAYIEAANTRFGKFARAK